MVDPISSQHVTPAGPARPAASPARSDRTAAGEGFADQLRQQLDQVSRMQAEADAGIQNLLTGRTDNITEVLTAARKAEIAFSLLMEIRNKLVDSYVELRQLRV
jgi:flagellar hook-basal body complex protein FliE